MSAENLCSAGVVKKILAKRHLKLKKRLGQTFLVDRNILKKILEAGEFKADDLVVEIGAGIGTLTEMVAPRVGKIWAIEIDRGLTGVLKETLGSFSNVEIVHKDALKIKFSEFILKEFGRITPKLAERIKIIGNIPYSLSTSLVIKILEQESRFKTALLLLPEDVVKRMKAEPATKAYGAFSLLVKFYAEVKRIRKISPTTFFPIPKVSSVLVKLERYKSEILKPKDKELFFEAVRFSFKQRRKKLSNALKPLFMKMNLEVEDVQRNSSIDLNRRGETLSFDEFVVLSDTLAKIRRKPLPA